MGTSFLFILEDKERRGGPLGGIPRVIHSPSFKSESKCGLSRPLRRLRQGSRSSRPLSETLSPKMKSERGQGAELLLVAPCLSSVGLVWVRDPRGTAPV